MEKKEISGKLRMAFIWTCFGLLVAVSAVNYLTLDRTKRKGGTK